MWLWLWPVMVGFALVVWLTVRYGSSARQSDNVRWVKEHGAPITYGLMAEVELVRRRQLLAALVGGVIGTPVSALLIWVVGTRQEVSFTLVVAMWVLPMAAMAIGRSSEAMVACRVALGTPQAPRSEVAGRLQDFVPRDGLMILRAAFLGVVLVLGASIGSEGQLSRPVSIETGLVAAPLALTLSSWAYAEILARQLAARASDAEAVTWYWRDALRKERLQDLYLMPSAVCVIALLSSGTVLSHSEASPLSAVLPAILVVTLLLIVTGYLLSTRPPVSERRQAALLAAQQAYLPGPWA